MSRKKNRGAAAAFDVSNPVAETPDVEENDTEVIEEQDAPVEEIKTEEVSKEDALEPTPVEVEEKKESVEDEESKEDIPDEEPPIETIDTTEDKEDAVESSEDEKLLIKEGYAVVFIEDVEAITDELMMKHHLHRVSKTGDKIHFTKKPVRCFVGPYVTEKEATTKRRKLLSYGVVGNVRCIKITDDAEYI